MSCVHGRFGGLQEEQCLGRECWTRGLQHVATKAVQNCLNPDFSYHRVSLKAVGMKTVCIDSRSTYPLEGSRACTGPWAKLSHGSARRSRLAVLLHPWLPSRQLGMQGRRRACHPSEQNVFLYLGKCWASLSRGSSASYDGSEHQRGCCFPPNEGVCNFPSGSHPQAVPDPSVRLYQSQNTPSPAQTMC